MTCPSLVPGDRGEEKIRVDFRFLRQSDRENGGPLPKTLKQWTQAGELSGAGRW